MLYFGDISESRGRLSFGDEALFKGGKNVIPRIFLNPRGKTLALKESENYWRHLETLAGDTWKP